MIAFRKEGARPLVMGILNVTPDSFSDGGRPFDEGVEHAYRMIEAGADIIDIGGESTRPGSLPVDTATELGRVIPMVERLSGTTDAIISVDTSKTIVAEKALDAGAHIINDINGLRSPGMTDLIASAQVPAVIMHMNGIPETMQNDPLDVCDASKVIEFLEERKRIALEAGIKDIIMDPGIGFGKTAALNEYIIDNVSSFSCGCPVLIGASRKGFLGRIYPSLDRDEATVMVNRRAALSGADILRVHDVPRTMDMFNGPSLRSVRRRKRPRAMHRS